MLHLQLRNWPFFNHLIIDIIYFKVLFTHLKALEVDSAVGQHVDKVMYVHLVEKDVDSNVPHSSRENIMKNVNIGKHVHHYGNHL